MTYPTLELDDLQTSPFSATTGNGNGLGNITFKMFRNGTQIGTLAFLNPPRGFAVDFDSATIYADAKSLVIATALQALIDKNGLATISFADVEGGNDIKIDFK